MEARSRHIPGATTRLFFQIKGELVGSSDTQACAYYLEYLALHMPLALLVPALEWLIKNDLIGRRFLQYVQGDCARSGLELIRNLTMRLEKEKRLRVLTAKDLRL